MIEGGPKQVVAVIDIGTSAIRMLVAEIGPKMEIRHLENLHQPVRFGREVFTEGRISNKTIRDAISILKNYKTVIETYGANPIHAIATSAVREAENSENFISQIYVRTGIDVEVIEGPEENRLQLIAVDHALSGEVDLEKKNSLIVEVGSGSTEIILLHQGQVEMTRTLSMGSIRLPEKTVAGKTDASIMQRILKRSIHEVASHVGRECNLDAIDTFIALGADMRMAVEKINQSGSEKYFKSDRKSFASLINRLSKSDPETLVEEYGMAYPQAETFYPSLLIYSNFLIETKAEEVLVPMGSIRVGLLLEMAQMLSGYKRTDVGKQVINSAKHLGEKYRYDKSHSLTVTGLAVKLFDALKEDHALGSKERLLLEVAGILHDIGTYISPSGHHKHSSYLINAAELFGLRKEDKDIIANVVRYHRRVTPRPEHVPYMSLPKPARAVVSKLAAILRVADALDHAHQQRIRQFRLERRDDQYILWVGEDAGDLSVERNSLRIKGDMFADVFGAPIDVRAETASKKAGS